MAKVIGPLLSIGASGQIGKSQIYAKWRGVPYARRYAVPSNPNTIEQQISRNTFKTLQQWYARAPGAVIDAFKLAALGKSFTDRNKFVQANLSNMRGDATMISLLASPGARGGPAIGSSIITQDATYVIATMLAPSLPTGWSVNTAYSVLFSDQPADAGVYDYPITLGEDAATPYVCNMIRLDQEPAVMVSSWFTYTKADGTLAASIAYTQAYTIT